MVFLIRQNMSGFDAEVGYASAISLTLFLVTIGLSIAFLRASRAENAS
jgi:multiple sugar transport system permease protein